MLCVVYPEETINLGYSSSHAKLGYSFVHCIKKIHIGVSFLEYRENFFFKENIEITSNSFLAFKMIRINNFLVLYRFN